MPLFLEHGLVHHKRLTLCIDLTDWKWNVMVQYCIPILASSICLATNDQFDSQFVKRLSNTLVACFFIAHLCLEFSCFKSHDCGFFSPSFFPLYVRTPLGFKFQNIPLILLIPWANKIQFPSYWVLPWFFLGIVYNMHTD